MHLLRIAAAVAAIAFVITNPSIAATPLPALGAEAKVTVSGVSSGGAMALQYAVAHADTVAGVGTVAAPPYGCAEGSVDKAIRDCMCLARDGRAVQMSPQRVAERMAAAAPLTSLLGQRVKIIHGSADETVKPEAAEAMHAAYRLLYARAGREEDFARNVSRTVVEGAGHGQMAAPLPPARDTSCSNGSRQGYLLACGYDAAADILAHLHPNRPVLHAEATAANGGSLIEFDQKPFRPEARQRPYPTLAGRLLETLGVRQSVQDFADSGYAYIPHGCRSARCPVHIALHGCRMTDRGHPYFSAAGYNLWAARYEVIVLYPRLQPDGNPGQGELCRLPATQHTDWSFAQRYNPNGCWDWWGYNGAGYASREGSQIAAIRRMVARLQEAPQSAKQ